MGDTADLDRFRREWRDEVRARGRPSVTARPSEAARSVLTRRDSETVSVPVPQRQDDTVSTVDATKTTPDIDEDEFSVAESRAEPTSALEHYERAVEKESQGSLGDSLAHYRKAYKLDFKVDQSYRKKHFPTRSKPENPNPSNAPVTVPNPAHHSSKEPTKQLSFDELIQSFAQLPILGAEPLIEGDIPPPCPMKALPYEVLLELLFQIASMDPAVFCRLSLVCKKLAYHVHTDNSVWKRIACGEEFGIPSQSYRFATDIHGWPAFKSTAQDHGSPVTVLPPKFPADSNWREVFHNEPRIRFTGVYISTVNYTRPGQPSPTSMTWGTNPTHIVTYYRYLRFFRDGTLISLLTTHEPADVVHHLTKENVSLVRSAPMERSRQNAATSMTTSTASKSLIMSSNTTTTSSDPAQAATLAPAATQVMRHALLGRWRLIHELTSSTNLLLSDDTPTDAAENLTNNTTFQAIGSPGDIHIETEGAGMPQSNGGYIYHLHLALRSGSKNPSAVRNNKLMWKGFWTHNSLTDSWGELHLRNDKAFWFSRVKRYGLGY